MSHALEYAIGAKVVCSDGGCGRLCRVVIDPVARVVTHLVVEPRRWSGKARLTPVELVDSAAGEVRLRCTTADFDALEEAEETHFISARSEELGYGPGEMYAWPYYGLGMDDGGLLVPPSITVDRVPVGEVEVRRGERVRATDGGIGHVQGLIVDPEDHHVTHVLLREGHLWGKRTVAIPISAVTDADAGGVRLTLTRAEVGELPSVDHSAGIDT
jgi:PRC-barrel domain